MKMSLYIFIIVILGTFTGYFLIPKKFSNNIDLIINIILTIMIFFIGIGIGQNKHLFKSIKKAGIKILVLPLGTIIGSLIGGLVAGLILNRSLTMSLAIASGLGWYSISSGLLLALGSAELATIGFLANVFREILAFLLIPLIAKMISPFAAISIGGATSMDTTLPLIIRSTNEEYALISFIHGFILSLLVPVLVQLFASI